MADTKYGDKMWQEQYERWTQMKPPIEFTREEDARPLIKKLGLHITDRKFVKEIKTTDAEYYGMDPWVTDEMAEVALKMTIHKPYTIPELEKMNKVIDREFPEAHRETLLVLDATTGKNAVSQAKEFNEVAELTGVILTKLDGTAKGGIAITIADEFDLPIKYIGTGEGIEDLEEFVPADFIGGIFHE